MLKSYCKCGIQLEYTRFGEDLTYDTGRISYLCRRLSLIEVGGGWAVISVERSGVDIEDKGSTRTVSQCTDALEYEERQRWNRQLYIKRDVFRLEASLPVANDQSRSGGDFPRWRASRLVWRAADSAIVLITCTITGNQKSPSTLTLLSTYFNPESMVNSYDLYRSYSTVSNIADDRVSQWIRCIEADFALRSCICQTGRQGPILRMVSVNFVMMEIIALISLHCGLRIYKSCNNSMFKLVFLSEQVIEMPNMLSSTSQGIFEQSELSFSCMSRLTSKA